MPKYQGYQERSADAVKARATQQGGMYDNVFKDGIKVWKPKVGDNTIRYMPPTFEDATHYGFDVWTHGNVGTDNNEYLCAAKMKSEACAVCDEIHRMTKAGAPADDIKDLNFRKSVVSWIIDRADEQEGPQIYKCGWTFDKTVNALCINNKTGTVLMLDHPEDGYDVSFKREGQRLTTKYLAHQIDRDPSPLSPKQKRQQEWLDYVAANPIDQILNYYAYEHIEKMLNGAIDAAKREEEGGGRRRARDAADEGDGAARNARNRRNNQEIDGTAEAEAKPARGAAARRAAPPAEEEDVSEQDPPPRRTRQQVADDDGEAGGGVDRTGRSTARRATPPAEEEEEEAAPRRPAARARVEEEDEPAPRRPAARARVEEPEEEEQAPRRGAARRPVEDEDEPAPRSTGTKRQRVEDDDDQPAPPRSGRRAAPVEEEDEPAPRRQRLPAAEPEEEEPAPRRPATTRRAPVDEEEEQAPRRPAARQRLPADEEEEEPAPRSTSTQAKDRLGRLNRRGE